MQKKRFRTIDLAYIALAAALIAICSWISIPTTVPFTLQTFAVMLCANLLGGWRSSLTIVIYMLLGLIGVPVFASFKSGPATLFGPTGGYILGFLFIGLIMWLADWLFKNKLWARIAATLLGIVVCYIFGTLWFMQVYVTKDGAHVGFIAALSICVFPFLIPEVVKIALALTLGNHKALRRVVSPADQPEPSTAQ